MLGNAARVIGNKAVEKLSDPLVGTAMLRAIGLTKIPLLFFIGPKVVELTEERSVIRVPLRWRTKNHLGVMYIGALAAGADLAGGLIALQRINASGKRVDLLFKDMKAEFMRRVEGDAYFTCSTGAEIRRAVEQTIETGERVNLTLPVSVTVPDRLGDVEAARFEMTLTLKRR
jgi:acyl-coenzyme A thioesterase PaaI-like protein